MINHFRKYIKPADVRDKSNVRGFTASNALNALN